MIVARLFLSYLSSISYLLSPISYLLSPISTSSIAKLSLTEMYGRNRWA